MARKKNTGAEQTAENTTQDVQEQEGGKDTAVQKEDGQTGKNLTQNAEQDAPELEGKENAAGDAPEQNETGAAALDDGKKPERDIFANLPNPCVYCGPTVRGMARQYTTYQGGIPNELREFIKAHPAARGLLVSTAKFASVRKRLDTPGTAEAVLFKKVKSQL